MGGSRWVRGKMENSGFCSMGFCSTVSPPCPLSPHRCEVQQQPAPADDGEGLDGGQASDLITQAIKQHLEHMGGLGTQGPLTRFGESREFREL